MLTNNEVRQQLKQLAETAERAEADLARSDDLPALDLAETMVEAGKLSTKLAKLADKVQRLSAPLFGPNGQDGAEQPGKAAGRGKRKAT